MAFEFGNVRNDKDICLKFNYIASNTILLRVLYNSISGNSFTYYLSKGDNELEICTSDFIFNHGEAFNLSLSTNIFGRDKFSVLKTISYKKVKRNTQAYKNSIVWDQETSEPGWNNNSNFNYKVFNQDGVQYKFDKINDNSRDRKTIEISSTSPVRKGESINLKLMTDWIEHSNKFAETRNEFSLKLSNFNPEHILTIRQRIIYWTNSFMTNAVNYVNIKNNEEWQKFPIMIPYTASTFKIVFEISITALDKDITGFELLLAGLTIGDSCYLNRENYCFNNAHCTSLTPESAVCQCDDKYLGKRCERLRKCTMVNYYLYIKHKLTTILTFL